MIEVNCPYCGKGHILRFDEMKKIVADRECILKCCECYNDYEVKRDSSRIIESKVSEFNEREYDNIGIK